MHHHHLPRHRPTVTCACASWSLPVACALTPTAAMPQATPPVVFYIALPLSLDDSLTPMILPCQGNTSNPIVIRYGTPLILITPHAANSVNATVGPILYSTALGVTRSLGSQSALCPAQIIMPRRLHPLDFAITLCRRMLFVSPSHSPGFMMKLKETHFLPKQIMIRRSRRHSMATPSGGSDKAGEGSASRAKSV